MDNFIQHTAGLLSKQECDTVIDFFENNDECHFQGITGSQGLSNPKHKIDTEMSITVKELCVDIRLHSVSRALQTACDEYIKNYPFLRKMKEWTVYSEFKIQRYNPNEAYFVEHCENEGATKSECVRRLIALMVYLNTVTDGGQTNFPTQNISFSPKVGDVLMWPAYWTHPHHGIVSRTQKKYIITGWYVFND